MSNLRMFIYFHVTNTPFSGSRRQRLGVCGRYADVGRWLPHRKPATPQVGARGVETGDAGNLVQCRGCTTITHPGERNKEKTADMGLPLSFFVTRQITLQGSFEFLTMEVSTFPSSFRASTWHLQRRFYFNFETRQIKVSYLSLQCVRSGILRDNYYLTLCFS